MRLKTSKYLMTDVNIVYHFTYVNIKSLILNMSHHMQVYKNQNVPNSFFCDKNISSSAPPYSSSFLHTTFLKCNSEDCKI